MSPTPPPPMSTGRHAVAGPPQWLADRLGEYVAGGCNGLIVNLGHETPGLEERVQRLAEGGVATGR